MGIGFLAVPLDGVKAAERVAGFVKSMDTLRCACEGLWDVA